MKRLEQSGVYIDLHSHRVNVAALMLGGPVAASKNSHRNTERWKRAAHGKAWLAPGRVSDGLS